jgi:TolB-like protein/Tfp pilus assembly protein PilF
VIYRFEGCEFDTEKHELRRNESVVPIEPQVFSLLGLLVQNHDRVVSKEEIVEKVWGGRAVSDSAIASRLKSARKAIGDDGRSQQKIRTVHGVGVRFVADVRTGRGGGFAHESVASIADGAQTEGALASDRPSIAVLPFGFSGEHDDREAIAEGLPYELITDLSRLRWLFVIARGSSFRFRSYAAGLDDVAEALGVRYCLFGKAEVDRSTLRVTAELVDTRDGRVVWADRFEGGLSELHRVRVDISARIVSALEIQIPLHEAALARDAVTEHLDSWAAFHLGLQHLYRFNKKDGVAAAALFERAVKLDPGFARAHAGLSFVHFQSAFLRHSDDVDNAVVAARRFAARAVELDPMDPFVNFTMGRTYWLEGDLDASLPWLDRATTVSPNYAHGIYARAWTHALLGRAEDAREEVDLAMNLSPLDPLYYAMLGTRAFTHLVRGDTDEAARWAERAARAPGAHVLISMIAVAAHALCGSHERATRWAKDVRARHPSLTRTDFFRSFPFSDAGTRERITAALRRVGF